MRILFLVPYFFPAWSYGGIPRVAYGLARALQDRGHEIEVICTDVLDRERRAGPAEERLDGVLVRRLPNLSNRLAYDHQAFLPPEALVAVPRAVAWADVVHLHGWWHLLGPIGALACRRQGKPLLCTPNGTLPAMERKLGPKRLYDLALGARVQETVARWLAVSEAEVNQFRRAGIAADRIDVVPNGVDLEEFDTLPPPGTGRSLLGIGEEPVVLYLGKLTPRKGVDHLVGAMARLQTKGARLVIAGNDMGARAAIERRVEALGLAPRVLFAGLVTGEARAAVLADADVLVYPSSDEIFGLVPFEGLLAGTPCVVSDDCGCGEVVRRARAGDLVRFGDERGLAEAIDGLLGDGPRRRLLVERGRSFVRRELAWPRLAARTEGVYRRVVMPGASGTFGAP